MTTSERQLLANRQNAKRSTGPKSQEGKQKASRNSLRHGLERGLCDVGHTDQIRTLALRVCDESDAFRFQQALIFAEAELTLARIRSLRVELLTGCEGKGARGLRRALARATPLERYERRAVSRRKRAVEILGLLRDPNLRPTMP